MDPKTLGWYVAAGCGAALIAVVCAGWLQGRERSSHAEPQAGVAAPGGVDTAALADAIARLDQRLARIENGLAALESNAEREPARKVAALDGESASVPSNPPELSVLQHDLEVLGKRIDALTDAVKEGYKPAFEMPTLEQFHAARKDTDWAFVEDLRVRYRSDPAAALERVRGMSSEELLKRIGLPTGILPAIGVCTYSRPFKNESGQAFPRGVSFYLVGDRVGNLTAYGD